MEGFASTFFGGVGAAAVAGCAWLSFLHPKIFQKIAIWILAGAFAAFMLSFIFSIIYSMGASAEWAVAAKAISDAGAPVSFPILPLFPDPLLVIELCGSVAVITGVLLVVSSMSPHQQTDAQGNRPGQAKRKPKEPAG